MDVDTIVTYAGYVVAILTALISLYKSLKSGQTLQQALVVMANTLKDEDKMVDGEFSKATVQKMEQVAMTIGANDVAVEEVKQALKGNELDLQLGSYKGKKIYLSDAMKIGSILRGLGRIFKIRL